MSCNRRLSVVPPCRVLISVSVISGWPFVSISASVSAFSESNSGLHKSTLGASFFLPFIYSAVKLYAISLVLSLCRCGFSISFRQQLLMIGISGLWSVMMGKCCKPARKRLHFITAHHTASISNSIVAYLDSLSVRKREPAWMRFHVVPLISCCKMKPSPYRLASMHKRVGLLAL